VFLVYVTILHERAHGKSFQYGTGEPARKMFPTQDNDDGDWLEFSLFGGIVFSMYHASDLSGKFDASFSPFSHLGGLYLLSPNKTKKLISDSWIKDFVCELNTVFVLLLIDQIETGLKGNGVRSFSLRRFNPFSNVLPTPGLRRPSRKLKDANIGTQKVKMSGGFVDDAGVRHKY
jgi:hypothetical protein